MRCPRSGRARHAVTLLAVALAAVVVWPGGVAQASSTELVDGLEHERLTVRLADGRTARSDVLRFPGEHPNLRLRTQQARNRVPGLETMPQIASRVLPRGGLATINGGFWVQRPPGAPNGFGVDAGGLVATQSETRTGLPRARGAVAIDDVGALVMDRLTVRQRLVRPDGETVDIDEVNRTAWTSGESTRSGELLAYDSTFGPSVPVPARAVLVRMEGTRLPRYGRNTGVVDGVSATSSATEAPIPADGTLLVAWGDARPRVAGIVPGAQAGLSIRPQPFTTAVERWGEARHGLPGGPLLLSRGSATGLASWRSEAFSDSHLQGRHPRTAIGWTPGGEVLLVTVDGRQSGWSVGMTMSELTSHMRSLGARDALALDGGGSTTMTVAGALTNRPSEPGRSVANAFVVDYDPPVPGPRDLSAHACPPEDVPDHDFRDIAGNVHEAPIACMVWYGVTSGRSSTSYDPISAVNRAQMATFLAAVIDHAAETGDGQELPEWNLRNRYDDVGLTSAHVASINRLADAGLVAGGPGGRPSSEFGPGLPVTREQMATFLAAADRYVTGEELPAGPNVFADDAGSPHEANIDRLAAAGIVTGRAPGVYAPDAPVRRDAMASFLMRLLDRHVELGAAGPPEQ